MNKFLFPIIGLAITYNVTFGQDYRLINTRSSSFSQIEGINLQTECDSESIVRYLKYWNNNGSVVPKLVDSVGCAPYSSEILIYGSKKPTDYIIFWVTDNEYTSDIHVFLLIKGNLNKLGELPILSTCETCDDIIYPIKRIKVLSGRNEVIIKLLDPFNYDLGNNNFRKYQPNELFFKIDKLNKRLITIDLQKRTEIQK